MSLDNPPGHANLLFAQTSNSMAQLRRIANLDLRPLYYFVHVAELGSFSKAAGALTINQPVLSRFIRRLESDLGAQLFYRNGRGVLLTEIGETFYSHATDILRRLANAETEVAAMHTDIAGSVVVGLPPMRATTLTVALTKHILQHYPRVRLSLREGFAAETLEWLSAGQIDIGVVYNAPNVSTLLVEPLMEDRLHLVGMPGILDAPIGSEIPASELANLPLILTPMPHRLRLLAQEAAQQAGVSINPVIEVAGALTVLELVRSGVGVTLLPSMLVQGDVADGKLSSWPLSSPSIHPRLYLVTSMQKPLTQAARTVLRTIGDILRGQQSASDRSVGNG